MIPTYMILKHRDAVVEFKGFGEDGQIERLVVTIGKLEFSFTMGITSEWAHLQEADYRMMVAKGAKLTEVRDLKTSEVAPVKTLVNFDSVLYILTDDNLEDAQYQKLRENFSFALGNSRHVLGESYIMRTMGAARLVDFGSNQVSEPSTALKLLQEDSAELVSESVTKHSAFGNATPVLKGVLMYHYKGIYFTYKVDTINTYDPEFYNEHIHCNATLFSVRELEDTRKLYFLESGGNLYIKPDLYLGQEVPEYYKEHAKYFKHDQEFHECLLNKGFKQLI